MQRRAELDGFQAAASSGQHRQRRGDGRAEGIDSTDVEPARVVEDVPAEQAVADEDSFSERACSCVEGVAGWRGGCGCGELADDAVEHLGCGLAGEGDGQDLARVFDRWAGKQGEESLNEQAGFAGAGGGLHQERA